MNNPSHVTPVEIEQNTASATTSKQAQVFNTLPPTYRARAAFYKAILHEVEESLPGMEPDQRYTLAMLCGMEFWNQLTNGDRRRAGIFMSEIVAKNLLPLCVADSRHEYPKYYRLK